MFVFILYLEKYNIQSWTKTINVYSHFFMKYYLINYYYLPMFIISRLSISFRIAQGGSISIGNSRIKSQ